MSFALQPVVVESLQQARSTEILPSIDLSKYGCKDWDYASIQYPNLMVNGEEIKLEPLDWNTVFDDLMRQEFGDMF